MGDDQERKLEPAERTVLEAGVGVVEGVIKVEPEPGDIVPWRYRHFIEGVATEKIAKEAGADVSRMARVFHKKDPVTGKEQTHIVGSADVVKEIANGLEAPKRELHTWYIGEAETVEEEREAVVPALEGLMREIPRPILSDEQIAQIAERVCAGQDFDKAVEAISEFKQGGVEHEE